MKEVYANLASLHVLHALPTSIVFLALPTTFLTRMKNSAWINVHHLHTLSKLLIETFNACLVPLHACNVMMPYPVVHVSRILFFLICKVPLVRLLALTDIMPFLTLWPVNGVDGDVFHVTVQVYAPNVRIVTYMVEFVKHNVLLDITEVSVFHASLAYLLAMNATMQRIVNSAFLDTSFIWLIASANVLKTSGHSYLWVSVIRHVMHLISRIRLIRHV